MLCTVGTPSSLEIDAISRLGDAGWEVAVRADFDEARLQHVAALLDSMAPSRPWRMGAADYLDSLARTSATTQVSLRGRSMPETPWDPALCSAMNERGLAAYEETLIELLLHDLRANPAG